MHTQPTATIDDPLFHRLADQVIDTNRSLIVSVGDRKVVIAPYHDQNEDETTFWSMIEDLRKETAHLSSAEQQRLADEMDDAILAERQKERQTRQTS